MRASRGEIKIEEILQQAGIPFQEEYSFPDLLSSTGHPLRFDFAIFDDEGDLEFLIEYPDLVSSSGRPLRFDFCVLDDDGNIDFLI